MEQGDERGPISALAGDGRDATQQEEVVDGVGGAGRGVALGRRVQAVDVELVRAVIGGTRVEDVRDVVPRAAAAAGGVDAVGVGLGLPVEHQRVAGADVHRLEVPDREDVFTVPALDHGEAVGAMDARVTAEVEVAGGVDGRAARDSSGVAELEAVDVGVAPDVRGVGVGGAVAGGDVATQDDSRAPVRVTVDPVSEDVDRGAREDLAVGRGGHVVADPQQDRGGGGDASPQDVAFPGLEESHLPVVQQREVLVE